MPIELPELPYPADALEPYISARTLSTHHGKHHRAYVDKTNALIGEAGGTLEETITRAAGDSSKKALFNNAAQAWNHAFYWRSLRPKGGSLPAGPLADPTLTEELKTPAKNHFGSGGAWLVRDGAELKVMITANADTPVVHGQIPLLVIDLWEHAYYLGVEDHRIPISAVAWSV